MLKKFLLCFLSAVLCIGNIGFIGSAANETQDSVLYVSPEANDDGDGSIDKPFSKIEQARDALRSKIKENPNQNYTVYLRGGIYNITNAVDFNEEDSVADGYFVTYKAFEGENVSIVCGEKIDNSFIKLVDDEDIIKRLPNGMNGKVYEVDLKSAGYTVDDYGKENYRGTYTRMNSAVPKNDYSAIFSFGGKMLTNARYPNEGFLHVTEIIKSGASSFSSDADRYNGITLPYPDVRCDRWATAKDAIIFGTLYYDWAGSSADLGTVDRRKRTISSKQGFCYGIRTYSPTTEGGKWYIYNLLEELDAPGEYYLDREANKLYFYPPESIDSGSLTMGYGTRAFNLENANNITFEGLSIEGARSYAIYAKNCSNILINKCEIKNSIGGITYDGGTNCGIVNSEIHEVDSGISLQGTDDQREFLVESAHYAINNHIYNWALWTMLYSSAARMSGVGNMFAKNKVHGAEHQAIQPQGVNNIVEYNEFYDTNRSIGDSGCLYEGQNFAMRGNVYRYNYFHDIGPRDGSKFVHCIYEDDTMSGSDIYGNIFENATQGVFLNGGFDTKIHNNIFIDCDADYGWVSYPQNFSVAGYGSSRYNTSMSYAGDNDIWKKTFPDLFSMEFSNPDFYTYVRGNEGKNNVKVDTPDYSFLSRCLVNSSKTGDVNASIGDIGFENKNEKRFSISKTAKLYDMFADIAAGFSKIGYEEDGLSSEEIEEYKKEMIKLDASLENEREQLINQSNERKIIVIKDGSSIYFKDGEYKLFSQKEAISPAYIDEKLALPIECAEAAGLTVTNSEGNAASISYNGKKASVNLMTDGEVKYIPVREVFEALEFNVIWNDNGSVVIYDRSLNFDKSVIDKYANKLY